MTDYRKEILERAERESVRREAERKRREVERFNESLKRDRWLVALVLLVLLGWGLHLFMGGRLW